MKSLTSVCLALGLSLGLCGSVLAGHRHHGCCYGYAAPVYAAPLAYGAPQAPVVVMQQEAPRDTLRDAFLPILVDLVRRQADRVGPETVAPPATSELSKLREELQAMRTESSSRFENVDQVLKAHGTAIVDLHRKLSDGDSSLSGQLGSLKSELTQLNAKVGAVEKLIVRPDSAALQAILNNAKSDAEKITELKALLK